MAVLLAVLVMMAGPEPSAAQTGNLATAPRYEFFSGVDATSNSIFGYAGAVWAFGKNVSGEGLRVKALTSTGGYDYGGSLPGVAGSVNFDGDVVLAQLLGGYLWRFGEWTVKAYAGIGFEEHEISPNDPANSVNGSEVGMLGQLELWRNLGMKNWLSADASYSDVFGGYWAQMRLGHRFGKKISAGIEGGALGNEEYDSGRAGGFLRYHLGAMELTLSGGVSGAYYVQHLTAVFPPEYRSNMREVAWRMLYPRPIRSKIF